MRALSVIVLGMLLQPGVSSTQSSPSDDDVTVLYFVRHAEVDPRGFNFDSSRLVGDMFALVKRD